MSKDVKYIKEVLFSELNFSEKVKDKCAKDLLEFLDEYWTIDKNGRPVPKCKFKLNDKLKQINKDVGFEMNEVF